MNQGEQGIPSLPASARASRMLLMGIRQVAHDRSLAADDALRRIRDLFLDVRETPSDRLPPSPHGD